MIKLSTLAAVGATTVLAFAGSSPVTAQNRADAKLAAAKSIACVFPALSVGDWKGGVPGVEAKPAKLTIGFDEIDTDEGTARVIGSFGPSEIIVRLSSSTLHFLQSFREGPLYATTIFPYESRPGYLRAVHTRHEFTEVSLPGFTSRPEQYVGECQITK